METITILIDVDDAGQPRLQVVFSSGVAPIDGIRACRAATERFQALAIEAEVERRIAERAENEEPPA